MATINTHIVFSDYTAVVLMVLQLFSETTKTIKALTYSRVSEVKKKQKKLKLRDVVAQGRSKSRRIKNVYGYFFPRAMLMLRETARKTGAFPEQANCNGVMIMSQRKCDKGCLYHRKNRRGLTLTRRRSVG